MCSRQKTFITLICSIYAVLPQISALISQNSQIQTILIEEDDPYEKIAYHQNKTVHDIMESRAKFANITCPELNNATFTNDPPFDILGLPECGDKIEPELKLYLNDANKTQCELNVTNLPNPNTTRCFELLKKHSAMNKLVLVTHGFLNNFDTNWLHTMQMAIQDVEPGTAVIVSITI